MTLWLIISLSIISVLCFLLWQFSSGSWADFGLNVFTETLGIILTVFLVDRIIKRQERRRLFPLKVAAFRDVGSFVDKLATFWLSVYNWSGKGQLPPPPEPPSVEEFLTMPYFELIRRRLNLNSEAFIFPKRTWWEYLPQAENEFRLLGEKILERHAAILDPDACDLVHRVLEGFLDRNIGLNMLPVLREGGGFGDQEVWEQLPEQFRHPLGR